MEPQKAQEEALKYLEALGTPKRTSKRPCRASQARKTDGQKYALGVLQDIVSFGVAVLFWNTKKNGPGPVIISDTFSLLYTFKVAKMCTAGQRVLRTITGPGPSYFYTFLLCYSLTKHKCIYSGCYVKSRKIYICKCFTLFRNLTLVNALHYLETFFSLLL